MILIFGGIPGSVHMMETSGTASSSSSWTRILLGSSSETETGGSSVNQPEAGLPANAGAPGGQEAGPSNRTLPVVPYPYEPDEVIGGDSVESIQHRLLSNKTFPSAHEIEMARLQAEDLFEVKVQIINLMAGLDPMGDWTRRGARALDNPHSTTGEPSISSLYTLLNNLQSEGIDSPNFQKWQSKRLPRFDEDEASAS